MEGDETCFAASPSNLCGRRRAMEIHSALMVIVVVALMVAVRILRLR